MPPRFKNHPRLNYLRHIPLPNPPTHKSNGTHRRTTVPLQHVRQNLLALNHPEGARENALPKVRAQVPVAQPRRDEGRAAELVPEPRMAAALVVLPITRDFWRGGGLSRTERTAAAVRRGQTTAGAGAAHTRPATATATNVHVKRRVSTERTIEPRT